MHEEKENKREEMEELRKKVNEEKESSNERRHTERMMVAQGIDRFTTSVAWWVIGDKNYSEWVSRMRFFDDFSRTFQFQTLHFSWSKNKYVF